MLTIVTGAADHVRRNRAAWDRWAAEYAGPGLRLWAASEPTWGIWNVAEAQAGVLPAELEGRDSIELGCGTGYVSAWLARRGARPVGLDNSPAQLATARQLQDRFGLRFPLIHASAEQAPFADASLTWPSRSTARASGAIPTPGSPRRPGCCAPADS
jgi:SAM-dependent methyltransferase